jgi:hypothetical protein
MHRKLQGYRALLQVCPYFAASGIFDRKKTPTTYHRHHGQICQPLTGNPEIDTMGNRTKRIFDDRVGQRCGQHTQTMLLQTDKRDTGEIIHDLSVPIYINGKHWGGLRMGYHPPNQNYAFSYSIE